MKEDFIIAHDSKEIGPLISAMCKEIRDLQGDAKSEIIRWHIFQLLSGEQRGRIFLREKKSEQNVGFAIFDRNRILFFYLSDSVSDKKIAAYILLSAVVSKMKELGADYIIADCVSVLNYFLRDDLSLNPSLLDFFPMLRIKMEIEGSKIFSIKTPTGKIYEHFSFYAFSPDEHRETVLQFVAGAPDIFVGKLFPPPTSKSLIEDYYRRSLFQDDLGNEIQYSPIYSTIAYDINGECVGFLLCEDDGKIREIRTKLNRGGKRQDLIRMMVGRIAENIDPVRTKTISISLYSCERSMIGYFKKIGFREVEEYPVWGWSKYMI